MKYCNAAIETNGPFNLPLIWTYRKFDLAVIRTKIRALGKFIVISKPVLCWLRTAMKKVRQSSQGYKRLGSHVSPRTDCLPSKEPILLVEYAVNIVWHRQKKTPAGDSRLHCSREQHPEKDAYANWVDPKRWFWDRRSSQTPRCLIWRPSNQSRRSLGKSPPPPPMFCCFDSYAPKSDSSECLPNQFSDCSEKGKLYCALGLLSFLIEPSYTS